MLSTRSPVDNSDLQLEGAQLGVGVAVVEPHTPVDGGLGGASHVNLVDRLRILQSSKQMFSEAKFYISHLSKMRYTPCCHGNFWSPESTTGLEHGRSQCMSTIIILNSRSNLLHGDHVLSLDILGLPAPPAQVLVQQVGAHGGAVRVDGPVLLQVTVVQLVDVAHHLHQLGLEPCILLHSLSSFSRLHQKN